MHAVNAGEEANYKIVKCQNPLCNICTRTQDGNGMPPSPVSEAIVVYTCSNPSCSLCDGDYSLLLDLVSPSMFPTEESFLQEHFESRNLENAICDVSDDDASDDDINYQEMFPTLYQEIQLQEKDNSTRSFKRKLSSHLGLVPKSRRHSTSSKLLSDEVDTVDENQLMNLAKELELDKVQSLPDLQKDVVAELTT